MYGYHIFVKLDYINVIYFVNTKGRCVFDGVEGGILLESCLLYLCSHWDWILFSNDIMKLIQFLTAYLYEAHLFLKCGCLMAKGGESLTIKWRQLPA